MSFLSVSVSETRRRMREKAEEEVKKKPAKLEKNKKAVKKMSIVGKLLQLKYRINETAKEEHGWSDDMSSHKSWIMTLISDVRKNNLTKLAREDVQVCNKLWKLYNVK
tara:strand:+ start:408 stop:731 length:324 start_codon:yes stop_codon:yes gene_type:complete